jgi:ATP-dependent helicase YprA (DUF1998 family)
MQSIHSLFNELGLSDESLSLSVGALDGDAGPSSREALRRAGIVLTSNPDMLHACVLPQVSSSSDRDNACMFAHFISFTSCSTLSGRGS